MRAPEWAFAGRATLLMLLLSCSDPRVETKTVSTSGSWVGLAASTPRERPPKHYIIRRSPRRAIAAVDSADSKAQEEIAATLPDDNE